MSKVVIKRVSTTTWHFQLPPIPERPAGFLPANVDSSVMQRDLNEMLKDPIYIEHSKKCLAVDSLLQPNLPLTMRKLYAENEKTRDYLLAYMCSLSYLAGCRNILDNLPGGTEIR